jgi:NADPH:quinone reductase-like Zn-dependent oxidoreductase
MQQVWISKAGSPEVLQVREAPDPEVGPRDVRIRVRAAGINFADLMARVGLYPDAPPIPCVVGYEVSGVIDQVGSEVRDHQEGDRVFGMPKFGGYTDTLVLPAAQAFRMPDHMTFEEGAALPVVYLTAHHMMFHTGTVHEGARVLIHSAAGGVGLAAIELAKQKSCVIYGTASRSKHAFLRDMGVHYTIDSQGGPTGYVAEVRALLDARDEPEELRGLDLILDPVGGSSWHEGYKLLRSAGRLVAFGASAMSSGKTRSLWHALLQFLRIRKYNPMDLMGDNKAVAGVNMGHLFNRLDLLRPQFLELVRMYEAGLIHPKVDKVFSFQEAAAAHHFLHDRKAIGKVLLAPDPEALKRALPSAAARALPAG